MDTVTAQWNGGRRFVAWDAAGHGVVMDASVEHKGEGTGVRPIETVLYALAGCTGMDVISVLEKKRQDVRSLQIRIEAEQRDEPPRRYDRIHIEYVVSGRGLQPAAGERAIELSQEKYCSVRGMFDPSIEVTRSFQVIDGE